MSEPLRRTCRYLTQRPDAPTVDDMADPIISNVVRAQCIWKGPSNLPEDRFVTTWAFVRETLANAGGQEQKNEVAERLREFWLDGGGTYPAVANYIPSSITAQGLEIRCYDLGQAPPREPSIYNYPVGFGAQGQGLPREVAIAMSFYAGRNLPRRRGRVFIGPLASSSIASDISPTVNPLLRNRVVFMAERLALGFGAGDSMRWGVLSQADQQIRNVTAGWVDDAFDTQRRRGLAPTTRTSWPPAPA